MHLACLNPNKAVLKVLLDQNSDFNVMDNQNNKPIHYAAVCSQPSSL
jgi:ankyrin repeat protein